MDRKVVIPIAEIELPEHWQFYDEAVKLYTKKYKGDEYVPPPIVFKLNGSYFIEDGAHRVLAARRAGLKTLEVIVLE